MGALTLDVQDLEVLKASDFLDSAWYTKQYPDVHVLGMEAAEHYLRFGARMLRDPGPRFSTAQYLQANPDVAEAGVNPLLHYMKFGRKECRPLGRHVSSSDDFASRVDVVVTVFNALGDVKKCLDSVRVRTDGFAVQCIVVNDGSDDETSKWLRSYCGAHAKIFSLIEHGKNKGYTRAANAGIHASSAPYVVLLNSDTVVTRGWLRGLVACMRSDPGVGIVGPLSNAASWQNVPALRDETGAFAVNELPSGMTPDDMAALVASISKRRYPRLPFVNGFCFMVRRDVIAAIGPMDEKAFPVGYGEENDYCLRAYAAGFDMAVADDAYVFHAKSRSFGHDRREELSQQGAEALRARYSAQRIDSLLRRAAKAPDLDTVRTELAAALQKPGRAIAPCEPTLLKILFLLPVRGGGGGAHSVMQEVDEMRRLGVDAVVAVRAEDLSDFKSRYGELQFVNEMLVGFSDETTLSKIAAGRDVVVGTSFDSMNAVGAICNLYPSILPAYYVQDYEPLFFAPDTPGWHAAKESYTCVPGAVLFAKTKWIADAVRAAHGLDVHVVAPSIDQALYRPTARLRAGGIQVCAMVRPHTPWRGAERTMRVLKKLKRKHGERIQVRIFGCENESRLFQALDRDFEFDNLGVLKRAEVASVLATSDLFLDLSDYQAFGRTALEAMACGCAAVIPAAGGAGEFGVDGVNCLVVDTFNEDEVIEATCRLLSDEALLRRMQVCALESASRYSVRRAAISELSLFSSEVARFRNRRENAPSRCEATESIKATVFRNAVSPQALAVQKAAPPKLPLTALVLTWDVGHNPLGRSYMLAEVIDRVVRNVVIAGFQFPRYGADVWEPLRHSRIPVIALPGSNLPEFLTDLDRIAARIRPDIVIACKPRLPSLQLGALIKERWGCPLVVDIDDHELSFFKGAQPLTLEQLSALDPQTASAKEEPFSEVWTRLCETLVAVADERIVSNVALHRRFGGTVVPHVRDEGAFDRSRYSKESARVKFGVPTDARVVLFFGTPRLHKGVSELAQAVGRSTDERLKLVIVGTPPDKSITRRIDELARDRVICIPNQPFDLIPEILMMADVVCLPQDETSPISHYQLPAKAIDAVAMGVPLLVTRTEPLMQLVEDGVAKTIETRDLTAALEAAVRDDSSASAQQLRTRFLARYSYDAAARQMSELIQRAIRNKSGRNATIPMAQLLQQQHRLLSLTSIAAERSRRPGRDHIVFWKQNDTTLYGRRHDMVIKYLASRADVRKVIVFDAPMSEFDLLKRRQSTAGASQDRWVYVRTYEKLLGKHDTDKISYNVFVHPPGKFRTREDDTTKPSLLDAYTDYLREVFQRESVSIESAVFWLYPKNYLASGLVKHFRPAKVVVDVVDDHRAWPGVSDAERERLTVNYRETLAIADMAFVNCGPMQQSMSEFCSGIRLVPNGCDLDPPRVEPRGSAVYDAFKAWPGKTIGFVGNLEAKIDIELIRKIAHRFDDCQIVLLGSTHANPAVRNLEHCANVRMPGVIPYEQLGAWMSRFDVGIVPHLDLPMTKNMNPLKMYVYLAANLPVVSTEIFNIDRDSEMVRVARSHSEFLEQIEYVLKRQQRVAEGQVSKYVASNSWARRFEAHVDELHRNMK